MILSFAHVRDDLSQGFIVPDIADATPFSPPIRPMLIGPFLQSPGAPCLEIDPDFLRVRANGANNDMDMIGPTRGSEQSPFPIGARLADLFDHDLSFGCRQNTLFFDHAFSAGLFQRRVGQLPTSVVFDPSTLIAW